MNKLVAKKNSTNYKMGLLPAGYRAPDDLESDTALVISSSPPPTSSPSVKVLQYSNHDGTTFGVYGKNSPSSPEKTPSIHSSGTTGSSNDSLLDNKGKLSFGSDLSSSSGHSSGDEGDYRCDVEAKPANNAYKYLHTEVTRTFKPNGLKYTNLTFTDSLPNHSCNNTPRGQNNKLMRQDKKVKPLPKPVECTTPRNVLGANVNMKPKSKSPPVIESLRDGVRLDKRLNKSTNFVPSPRNYTSQISLSSSINSTVSSSSSSNSSGLMLSHGGNDSSNILQINPLKSRHDRLQPMPPESRATTIPTIMTPSTPELGNERLGRHGRRSGGHKSLEGQLGEILPSRVPISRSRSVRETRSNTGLITPRSIRPATNHSISTLLNTQPRSKSKTDEMLTLNSRTKVDELLKQSRWNNKPDDLVPMNPIHIARSQTEDSLHISQLEPKPSGGVGGRLLRPSSLLQFAHQSHNDPLQLCPPGSRHSNKHKSRSLVDGQSSDYRLRKKSWISNTDSQSNHSDVTGSDGVPSAPLNGDTTSISETSSNSPESSATTRNVKCPATTSSSRATSSITANGSVYPDGHGLVTIKMHPDNSNKFGFNVKGGTDQGMPIIVSRVAPGSQADVCIPRLNEGDQVLYINGRDVSQHTHEQIVMFIRASREQHSRELVLVVRPNVYIGDDTPEEPDFSYIPDTVQLTNKLPPGTDPLTGSMILLEQALKSDVALNEFEQLYRKKPGMTMNISKAGDNVSKNRYRDISPYDQTRVVINNTSSDDYINANYVNMEIPGSGIVNCYIAAQGPLPNTCADFWQMVWEQQSRLVVMLTTKVERGRVKCHQYWPQLYETINHDHLEISCIKEQTTPSFAFREYTLVNSDAGNEERHIEQMQYTSWPDHGVPEESTDFLEFVQKVRQNRAGMVEPTIVHCSAGIGRTGVLITMETAMCLIEANQAVYPLDIVRQMRDQRAMLIQTPFQYKFVCEAILDVFKNKIVEPLDDYKR